jgi:hypothetical protein
MYDRLRAMQAFVLVVDSGSFSRAARRLNVGQPALSKSIAHSEQTGVGYSSLGQCQSGRPTRGIGCGGAYPQVQPDKHELSSDNIRQQPPFVGDISGGIPRYGNSKTLEFSAFYY